MRDEPLADTIRPRLDAAEGDPARVHALTDVSCVDGEGCVTTRSPTLADVESIRDTVERTNARLLVVDVLMAYMPGKADAHRDQDVRGVLRRLAAVAESTGCTVLMLRHLNKTGAGNPLYRGGRSIGIVGAARAGYLVARDPEDESTIVFACTKNNLAPVPPSMTYRLESTPDSHVARVMWTGECTRSAGDLLRTEQDTEEHGERDEAAEWLIAYLSDHTVGGSARASEITKAARADGIAERTLKRARARAGVTSERRGFGQGAVWSLDPSGPHSGRSGQHSTPGTNGPNDGPIDEFTCPSDGGDSVDT